MLVPVLNLRGRRQLIIVVLLTIIVAGVAFAGVQLWCESQFRSAREALAHHDLVGAHRHIQSCLRYEWPPRLESRLLAAQTARRTRRYDEAERWLNDYRKQGGVPDAVSMERALSKAQRGELAGLEPRLLQWAQEDVPESALVWEALAQGYMQTYRWPQALNALKQLLERQPDYAEAYVWRGWVRENLSQIPAARDDYRQAVALDPENPVARQSLADLLVQGSLPDEAIEQLEWLRQRQPDEPAVLLGLARARQILNQPEEARQLLDRLLELHPQDPHGLAERGRLALSQGQVADAERWLRQAADRAPNERQVHFDLFRALTANGKTEEAKACQARLQRIEADADRYQELIAEMLKRPRDLAIPCAVAEIMLRNQQPEQARRWLDSVLQQNPNFKPAHKLLSEYYESQGDSRRAAEHRRAAG